MKTNFYWGLQVNIKETAKKLLLQEIYLFFLCLTVMLIGLFLDITYSEKIARILWSILFIIIPLLIFYSILSFLYIIIAYCYQKYFNKS
jgi:ACR3 family arsenite efflux pump ArsB